MKEGWEYKKLGEVIEHLRTGLNPRTHFKLNTPDAEGYYVTVRELKGFSIEPDEKTDKVNSAAIKRINERSNLKIGDVLFSGTGTIGKTALVSELPENWNIKEGVYAMTPKHSELDSKYFIYYIGSEFFLRLVNDKAAGTGVRSIPMKELVKLPIHLPPLSEQQSIVNYLDLAFAKIDAMKANAEKALNEAKALFQASLKEMLEPKEGWEEKKIGEICELSQGLAINSKTRYLLKETGQLPLLRIKDMKDGTREIFVDEMNCPQSCIANEDDIIYTRTGTLGLVFTGMKGVLHNNCFKIVYNKSLLEKTFLMYFLGHEAFKSNIIKLASRAAQPDITHKLFKAQEIVFPPISEQQSIVATLDSLKSKVDRLKANYDKISQECDALKQAILRQVFE